MLSLILAAAVQSAQPAPADLSWLAGYWLSCDRGREVSETWTGPRGGVLLGASLTTERGKVSHELSRIGPSRGGVSYFAMPSGQKPAEFPLKSASGATVVFENLAHDFPQRITYTRAGSVLTARIEGPMNGRPTAMSWRYRSARLNQRCAAR